MRSHLKCEGLEQHSQCLVASIQLGKLEVEAYWEAPLTMICYRQPQGFGPITTINRDQTGTQAATISNYLQEHFGSGKTLLKAIQTAWDWTIQVNIELYRLWARKTKAVRRIIGDEYNTRAITVIPYRQWDLELCSTAAGVSNGTRDSGYRRIWPAIASLMLTAAESPPPNTKRGVIPSLAPSRLWAQSMTAEYSSSWVGKWLRVPAIFFAGSVLRSWRQYMSMRK